MAASPPIAAPSASASASTAAPPIPARVVTRYYDPLLEKVTAWAPTPDEAIHRMDRALREYRIRGVATNLAFLQTVLNHPHFVAGDYTTRFIDETPELFSSPSSGATARRSSCLIADVTVNGHPETRRPARSRRPLRARRQAPHSPPRRAPRHAPALKGLGPKGFAQWMREAEARAGHRHDDARRAPVAARDALPHPRHAAVAPAYAAACRSSSRWNAGAAPPSTSRCASCRKTRGSAWR